MTSTFLPDQGAAPELGPTTAPGLHVGRRRRRLVSGSDRLFLAVRLFFVSPDPFSTFEPSLATPVRFTLLHKGPESAKSDAIRSDCIVESRTHTRTHAHTHTHTHTHPHTHGPSIYTNLYLSPDATAIETSSSKQRISLQTLKRGPKYPRQHRVSLFLIQTMRYFRTFLLRSAMRYDPKARSPIGK